MEWDFSKMFKEVDLKFFLYVSYVIWKWAEFFFGNPLMFSSIFFGNFSTFWSFFWPLSPFFDEKYCINRFLDAVNRIRIEFYVGECPTDFVSGDIFRPPNFFGKNLKRYLDFGGRKFELKAFNWTKNTALRIFSVLSIDSQVRKTLM